jgi:hypothetical protein
MDGRLFSVWRRVWRRAVASAIINVVDAMVMPWLLSETQRAVCWHSWTRRMVPAAMVSSVFCL